MRTANSRRSLAGLPAEAADGLRETYCITGLLHDFDYEKYPSAEEHPFVGNKILAEQGWPEEIREAIMGHAQYSGVARKTHLAKALFACDELAGFLTAVSLVKPTRSIFDVDVASVRKKMKDKAFARGVHREDIIRGRRNWGSNSTPILLSASPPCAAPPRCWDWKAQPLLRLACKPILFFRNAQDSPDAVIATARVNRSKK